MDEAEKAYIAGILDADGCISYRFKGKKWKSFQKGVFLINTKYHLLESIKILVGGTIQEKEKYSSNQAACYHLILRIEEVENLLPQILPYMRNKFMQAIYLLQTIQNSIDNERKHMLASETKKLNKRGNNE